MTVSIITCPSCNAILLEDTAQCPACHHVLTQDAPPRDDAAQVYSAPPSAVTKPPTGEVFCSACGEGVRIGMVRCWNCGTFMQPEMADAYQQKLMSAAGFIEPARPEPPAWTQAADEAAAIVRQGDGALSGEIPRFGGSPTGEEDIEAQDEDFVVAPQFALRNPTIETSSYSLTWQDTQSGADEIPLAPIDEPAPRAPAPQIAVTAKTTESSEPETIPLSKPKSSGAAGESPRPRQPAPSETLREAAGNDGAARSAVEPSGTAAAEIAGDGTAHSVATAGDVLLQIALDEEKESTSRRSRPAKKSAGPRARSGMLIYCPSGHRVEVQEKHRGLVGRCPRCKQPFFVPAKDAQPDSTSVPATEGATAPADSPAAPVSSTFAAAAPGGPNPWLKDISAHTVNMAKVKPKPGCLAKPTHAADVVVRPEGLLVLTLAKAGGLFGGAKKVDPIREAAQTHLQSGRPAADLPVAARVEVPPDAFAAVRIVQPAAYAHESPFGEVAVFASGRIAVQLPAAADAIEKTFLSFTLTQFREFAALMKSVAGQATFGDNCGIPLADAFTDLLCHYSDRTLRTLNDVAFYQADPAFKVELAGRRCAECGLVVSEDSRKKEKIGGASGSGIAKAKCPKCQKRFGDISLYSLPGT